MGDPLGDPSFWLDQDTGGGLPENGVAGARLLPDGQPLSLGCGSLERQSGGGMAWLQSTDTIRRHPANLFENLRKNDQLGTFLRSDPRSALVFAPLRRITEENPGRASDYQNAQPFNHKSRHVHPDPFVGRRAEKKPGTIGARLVKPWREKPAKDKGQGGANHHDASWIGANVELFP